MERKATSGWPNPTAGISECNYGEPSFQAAGFRSGFIVPVFWVHSANWTRIRRFQGEWCNEAPDSGYYFVDPVVLPESPEFLMGGLLTAGSGSYEKQPALWRGDPDSVFVLSRDRLGDEGRLQVSRISGPAGKQVWSTVLPLSNMSAWLPSEDHAMMLGPDPSAGHSPMAEEGENPVMQIITIDLKTGAVKTFNPDLHRDWPVEDHSEEKP